MNEKQRVPSPNERQIEIWKQCWDFLGGTKLWSSVLKK